MDMMFFNVGVILEILGTLVVVAFLSPASMFIGEFSSSSSSLSLLFDAHVLSIQAMTETQSFSFLLGVGISTLGRFSGPAQTSVLTALVPADQVGGALGAMCVADAITITFAYLLFGVIFAHTSATKPWMYLYVGALLNLLAVCIGLSLQALYRRRRIAL